MRSNASITERLRPWDDEVELAFAVGRRKGATDGAARKAASSGGFPQRTSGDVTAERGEGGAPEVQANLQPTIPNGFYTVTFPCGSSRTFRIRTERSGNLEGQRTIGLLIGPINTEDYEGFGFVTDDGIKVWKRFRGTKQEEYAGLVWLLATGCEADGYELLISKRCYVCNRPLTTPTAIERGIGDTCWKRMQRGN